jgi:glycosyltransferase involved in cell wall biosynthesis
MNKKSIAHIEVGHFQRCPRFGFNFSIEAIFEDVRERLASRVEINVFISSHFNDGIKTKFFNILEAGRRQTNGINHITGEVHFLNLLMDRRRVVLTIHDCRFMNRKANSRLQSTLMKWLYLKAPVRQSAVVTTVSEATKVDIVRYTGCDPGKIIVIPVAVHESFQPTPNIFKKSCPKILQIGTGDNKNLTRLSEALKEIPCHLTIIGRLSEDQRKSLQRAGIDYTNKYSLSRQEIVAAYEACDIVSFVSLFEGFGMPIIEANMVERVVLTSNISSMPEVAGDAALLVDPYSVADIRRGLNELIQDEALRSRLISNGRRNRERFSPQVIAEQYYELYRSLADASEKR